MVAALIEDTRQKPSEHTIKNQYWADNGINVVRSKLVVGDYMFVGGTISVDTKKHILELCGNIQQQHARFKRELILARDIGIKLYVLVENKDNIDSLKALYKWQNPRRFINRKKGLKDPISGARLTKACKTMEERYGVTFEFCTPNEAGAKVLELLGGGS